MSTLVRWVPSTRAAAPSLNRFFEDLWNNLPDNRENDAAAPAMDIIDHEDRVEVQVNLPGIAPENVSIEFDKGILSIGAETRSEETEQKTNYTRRERYVGTFRRSLRVPETLDTHNATANFENGVLYLSLPKKPEAQPLRIQINAKNN
jgi:HSP20 family protein